MNRQMGKTVEKEEKEREEAGSSECVFVGSNSSDRRSMCCRVIVRVCVYLSVRLHRSVLFIHRVGAAQETARRRNRSFPRKKGSGRSPRFYRRK